MKDGKKWIYKRYEGKFAYFPIISTWHLVHGLFLIHGARKENCFSSSRAEYRSDELGNASISVPLRFLTLLALPDGYPANADVFVPSRIFGHLVFLPSSITGDQGERNDEDIQFVGYLLFERDIRCRDTTLDGRGWWSGVRRKKRW